MTGRLYCSEKALHYLKTIQIFYYPDKSLGEVLDGILDCFETDYELKLKLMEE